MKKRSRGVWITGARTGIGRAFVDEFLGRGWSVVASSRNDVKRQDPGDGTFASIPVDVRDPRSVSKAWKAIGRLPFTIDMLINNAGITSFSSFEQTSYRQFRDIVDTNLTGSFLATKAVLGEMKRRRSGIIINILSFAARKAYTMSSAYGASKAGAHMLANVLRMEMRPFGIRVVNVLPGAVATPMWPASVRRKRGDQMMSAASLAKAIADLVTLDRSLVPEEIVLRPPTGDVTI